jgi:hypothetical protein
LKDLNAELRYWIKKTSASAVAKDEKPRARVKRLKIADSVPAAFNHKASNHCVVSESELSRVWPTSVKDREEKMKAFALRHGLQVAFFKQGVCAIFIRRSRLSTDEVKPKQKRELEQLRKAAEWLKRNEQRYAKQRKQIEARYRKLVRGGT